MTAPSPTLPPAVPPWAREIVLRRTAIGVAVTALVHGGVVIWALPPTLETAAPIVVGSVIDLFGVAAAAWWARRDVTPADPALSPITTDGRLLVPEGSTLARPPLVAGHRTGNVKRLAEEEPRKVGDDPQHPTWPQP